MPCYPNCDRGKCAGETESIQTEGMAKRKGMLEAWLAAYDKLNPVQRGHVREFLRSSMGHGEHARAHMGWMHRGMQGGQEKGAPGPTSH